MQINGYTFNSTEQWQVDYLKQHYQDMKLADLENELDCSDWKIYRLLKALGLTRQRHYYRKLNNTSEVNADLANPYLSHVHIAKKYNVTPDVVAQRRKRKGLAVRRNVSRTLLEETIAEILTNLDITFHEQKRIGKWSIDFYLGNRICLDVHGTYIHKKSIAIDRDIRKIKDLKDLGYIYLVIHEKDINKAKHIILRNIKEYFTWLKQEQ